MNLHGVVDSRLGEAIELFFRREDAERVVRDWDLDEPAAAGDVRVDVERIPFAEVTSVWRRQAEGPGRKLVVVP